MRQACNVTHSCLYSLHLSVCLGLGLRVLHLCMNLSSVLLESSL